MQIMFPAYVYPLWWNEGDDWERSGNSYPALTQMIMNPASGPGTAANSDYQFAVNDVNSKGVKVLGYVPTTYSARSATDIKTDIDKYYSWYNVKGIFLDEGSSNASDIGLYKEIYEYIKAKDQSNVVVLNPGVDTHKSYAEVADTICIFEGDVNNYLNNYVPQLWHYRQPKTKFCHIIHSITSDDQIDEIINKAESYNAGFIYITPRIMPNPYDQLPSNATWTREVNTVNKTLRNRPKRLDGGGMDDKLVTRSY